MNTLHARRRPMVSLLLTVAAFAVGTAIGARLAAYGVPSALVTTCALGTASSSLWLLARIEEALTTTTHRCTAPGCTFQVRMRNTSAAESRRWQEITAAHPRHDDQ